MATPRRIGATGAEEDLSTAAKDYDPNSMLADIASELEADATDEEELTNTVVPLRPNFRVLFRKHIDYDDVQLWLRMARNKTDKSNKDPHMLRLAYAVLSNTIVGMQYKGNEAKGKDGRPLVFVHPDFVAMVKPAIQNSVPALIKKFYGNDAHVIATMNKIMEEAGYSGEIDLEMGEQSPLDG